MFGLVISPVCARMSLVHTSDDALQAILYYLHGQDILRLNSTGAKWFMARLERHTEHLLWEFSHPTFFPSCSYLPKPEDSNGPIFAH